MGEETILCYIQEGKIKYQSDIRCKGPSAKDVRKILPIFSPPLPLSARSLAPVKVSEVIVILITVRTIFNLAHFFINAIVNFTIAFINSAKSKFKTILTVINITSLKSLTSKLQ